MARAIRKSARNPAPVPPARAAVAAAALASLTACQGPWPDLGTVPEGTPITPQPPVTLPAPQPSPAPLDVAAARDALAILPGRFEEIRLRISGQQAVYERARREAEASREPVAVRGAQLQLSRLSALETRLKALIAELDRIRASTLPPAMRREGERLAARVAAQRDRLADYAAAQRLALAGLPGTE